MKVYQCVMYLYPTAKTNEDFRVEIIDDELKISDWKVKDSQGTLVPQPTMAELEAAWPQVEKDILHKQLKAKCEADIKALGEDKAHSIAAKKAMGNALTVEEETCLSGFITTRDSRLAQYENDKSINGIV